MSHSDSAATTAASRSWWAAFGVGLLLLLPALGQAQQRQPGTEPDLSAVPDAEALRPEPTSPWTNRTIVFEEAMPTFRGGGALELRAYMQQQVRWPAEVRDLPNGRLFATFMVDPAGQVCDARIICGLHPLIDAEVLRVVRALSGFTPARQGNKPVSMDMTVPVEFKIR